MEIRAGDNFVQQDTWKRGGEDKGAQLEKRPRNDKERVVRLHTNPQNILMEIKGMLRGPKLIETLAKF